MGSSGTSGRRAGARAPGLTGERAGKGVDISELLGVDSRDVRDLDASAEAIFFCRTSSEHDGENDGGVYSLESNEQR